MAGEAQFRERPSHPPAPRGLTALVEECKLKLRGATWPQPNDTAPLFRTKIRRSIDTIVKEYGGTVVSYIWLALAWAKQKGHVPPGVNLTESGCTAPLWVSEVLWDLTPDADGHRHRGWRLLLAGFRASSGTDGAPSVDPDSVVAAHRLMNVRKQGLGLEGAIEMVNWMAEQCLVESPQRAARTTVAKQTRVARKPAKKAKRGMTTKQLPEFPPAKPVRVRRIPVTIKNPCMMLHT